MNCFNKTLRNQLLESSLMRAEFKERLENELAFVEQFELADYFIKTKNLVDYLITQGHKIGPTLGTANSSLINYLLGITSINPLDFNLIFERFLDTENSKPYFHIQVSEIGNVNFEDLETGIEDFVKLSTFYKKQGGLSEQEILSESNLIKNTFKHEGVEETYKKLSNKSLIFQENWIISVSKLLHISLNEAKLLYRKTSKRLITEKEFIFIFSIGEEHAKIYYQIAHFLVCKSHIIGEAFLDKCIVEYI